MEIGVGYSWLQNQLLQTLSRCHYCIQGRKGRIALIFFWSSWYAFLGNEPSLEHAVEMEISFKLSVMYTWLQIACLPKVTRNLNAYVEFRRKTANILLE